MNSPIKVLHLIPTLSSGGAERQLVNLVRSTSRHIVEHIVCVIGEADFFGPQIRESGFSVIELGITAKRPFLSATARFRKAISTEKPDIIHSWLYDANISARLARFLGHGKIPLITSLQLADYDPDAAQIGNWNPHKVRGLKAIDRFASYLTNPYFVPCSKFVLHSYRKHYGIPNHKAKVIYNSVDPKLLSTSQADLDRVRTELSLPLNAFVYLNVGRLDPQKNHKLIFEAFRQTVQKVPNAFLLLAGVGGMENELKALSMELGIGEKVLFLGRRNDVNALLEIADVFVFPSFFEGLPVALVEAMFKSLPCIASKIDVFREVITDGENGLLVDPTSPLELEEAMLRLYKDSGLRLSMGERAFQKADANFSASVTATQWEEFYERVFGESRNS